MYLHACFGATNCLPKFLKTFKKNFLYKYVYRDLCEKKSFSILNVLVGSVCYTDHFQLVSYPQPCKILIANDEMRKCILRTFQDDNKENKKVFYSEQVRVNKK